MSRRFTALAFAFLATLSLTALSACGGPPPPVKDASQAHVDGSKAKKLVEGGAKLVDVRGADEYGSKHIEGAENDPVETIEDADLGSNKDAPIVLYCDSGGRASRAAEVLRKK